MVRKRSISAPPPAELAILRLLWKSEPLTARQIREVLYPTGNASDQATVQKLLQRLEAKRLVKRSRKTFAHTFSAAVDRHAMASQELEMLAERLTDGSLVPLIMCAVRTQPLSPAERQAIRNLLDGAAKD